MDSIVEKLKANYNAVAYQRIAYKHAHPERIAVIAALQGLPFAPVTDCRVLEIGSASGDNLIAMAKQLPASRFVGFDLSDRQVEVGCKMIDELGLRNIEFRCRDILDFPSDIGQFDYIIAHGVYSWVPKPVQDALLRLCERHLSTRGLAYVSYNTYPGWHQKEVVRDMMLYHARAETDPMECLARGREVVKFVFEHSLDAGFYKAVIGDQEKPLKESSDHYLVHEYMAPVNEPIYFWKFVEEARNAGLEYVGEAAIETCPWATVPVAIREMISKMSSDPLEREQYLDFLRNRSLRSSVLCRANAVADSKTMESRIGRMYVAGNPPEAFAGKTANGLEMFQFGAEPHMVHISDPRPIAVLRHLRKAWPSALPFSELASVAVAHSPPGSDPAKISAALVPMMELMFSLGIIEFRTHQAHAQ